MALQQKVSKKAQSKLRKDNAEVEKALKEFKVEKIELKAATFQAEVIKRKFNLEEIFWRFPHIGELIIEQLDNQSLTKTREVNKWWQSFVENEKCFYIRKIQEHIYISNVSVRKKLRKETVQSLKELESFSRKTNIFTNKYCIREHITGPASVEDRRNEVFHYLPYESKDNVTYYAMLLAKIMLENMKDKNPLSKCGNTALHEAASCGNLPMFKMILNYTENISPRHELLRHTPLHNAAEKGHYEMCEFIIEHVQDLNPVTCWGKTPFDLAEKKGHKKICELLKSALSKESEPLRNPRKKRRL